MGSPFASPVGGPFSRFTVQSGFGSPIESPLGDSLMLSPVFFEDQNLYLGHVQYTKMRIDPKDEVQRLLHSDICSCCRHHIREGGSVAHAAVDTFKEGGPVTHTAAAAFEKEGGLLRFSLPAPSHAA
jgi:hypothetical protein